jgi:hypothetical protein
MKFSSGLYINFRDILGMTKRKVSDNGYSRRNADNYETETKVRFNAFFAEVTTSVYKENPGNVIYLDHEQLATTSALLKAKIKLRHLHSPNLNHNVVNALSKRRVHTDNITFEKYVISMKQDEPIVAAYYDGCGSVIGNLCHNVWPMNCLMEVLRKMPRNHSSILAFTTSLRGGSRCKGVSAEELRERMLSQMTNLVLNCGFTYDTLKEEQYRNERGTVHLLFCCLKLTPHNKNISLHYDMGQYLGEYTGFRPE